jgi:hypothetical protein
VFACWLALALTAGARADELVLYEAPALRPGLCAALRIQLTGVAEVSCRPDLPGDPAGRIARAANALAGDERLAVLLESDQHYARMLLVGTAADRALLAVEPVEERPEPDVDRALALKVREVLETSRAQPSVSPQRPHAVLLELGGALSAGAHTRALAVLALGLRATRARRFGELVVFGRLASRLEQARVREHEWELGLSARAGFVHGRFSLGPALDLGVVRARAYGRSEDGRSGDAALALPRFGLALDLRVTVHRALTLRFAPTLQLDPVAHRFSVEDRALSLGHLHVLLPLTLVLGIDS